MHQPSLDAIRTAADELADAIIETPVLPLSADRWQGLLPKGADVTIKLELFQQTGAFKARGALLGIRRLGADQRAAGVVAASGGNHALGVSWAAKEAGISALICMPRAVDPARIAGCKALGAEVQLFDDMAGAFAAMNKAAGAGRTLMHPFEADHMVLGAATCGLEYCAQAPDVDVFVVPVGGGGLISGMASAIRHLRPNAQIIGVEPFGADSLYRSLASGQPETLDKVDTMADSLGAPMSLPGTFGICQKLVDEVVRISDAEMAEAMRLMQAHMAITAEPACAASLAAIMGPLKHQLAGCKIGIIACGSNISIPRFAELTALSEG
ncbi:threonine/serine dehydratase [Yoonia sp. BS5-3]|uniref:Threonine/serine dehydratase n=1 Tax=Yoonia phaeophyticola TaxID=3137369 RepID=A0ABZ2V4K5_9RHOB